MLGVLAAESLTGLKYFTADKVLSPYVFVFYAAYGISFLFTPVLRHIAVHYGYIDEPDGLRKFHHTPVAYLGGVAVFLGWLSGLAISQFLTPHYIPEGMPLNRLVISFAIIVAACVVVLLGLWDDVIRISPWMKITGQLGAATCLVLGGVGQKTACVLIDPILRRTGHYLGIPSVSPEIWMLAHPWIVTLVSIAFVFVIVIGCCNAANLMDGLDGLCGGVTAIVAAGFLFLSVHLAMSSGAVFANQDALRVVLGLALLGGVLGFVPYNFNPASIFMGDAGSMFLGFVCALLMILFADGQHFKWFLAALVMFSLPILDTALAFVRRWVNGRPIFSPDRYHFHHQLVARGFSVKQTVIISYLLSVIFALLGASIVFMRSRYAVAIYLVVFGSIIVAAFKMGMVHERVDLEAARKRFMRDKPVTAPLPEQLPAPEFADSPDSSRAWSESANAPEKSTTGSPS